ncbi:MAG: hypothetical protein PF904_20475 [Kiritimatiellae bacterium]|nr:hypothetical protein [Kiritimatiellia bacterium]
MKYDPDIHHRQSIRLQGHDYAQAGYYFVTICTQNRRPLFGTIANGRMGLNDVGRIAAECWRQIPAHFPNAVIDEWVIMPDHVHGVIQIVGANNYSPSPANVRANDYLPLRDIRAIDAGRLLIITPFSEKITGFSAARAAWCNQYVLDAAEHIVVGCLSQDGMLACLLVDMRNDSSVQILSYV